MSASVVVQPVDTRIAPRLSSAGMPIAAKTCDRSTFPEEQAEPELTAMPSRSRAIRESSALLPGMAKQVVFGRRFAPSAERRPRAGGDPCNRLLQLERWIPAFA